MKSPAAGELEERALSVPERAGALAIVDAASYTRGAELLLQVKELRGEVADTFDPLIEKAHAAHKAAIEQKKKFDGPLAGAESGLKRKLGHFDAEQERLRRLREVELDAEAAQARDIARIQEAAALEAAGEIEAAAELLAAPVFAAPVVLAKTTPTVAGVSTREIWKFRIVADSEIPREYLVADW